MKYILIVFIFTFLSCNRSYENVFGEENLDIEETLYVKDATSLNDGYLFEIHKVSRNSLISFINNKNKLKYPKKSKYFDDVNRWEKTPFDDDGILELILSNYTKDVVEIEKMESFRKALLNDSNYYAFRYNEIDGIVHNVEFYLVDIKSRKLYIFDNA